MGGIVGGTPSFRQDRRNPEAKDGYTQHRCIGKIAIRGDWTPVSIQE